MRSTSKLLLAGIVVLAAHRICLAHDLRVNGRVIDACGEPVAGAAVVAFQS